MLQGFSGERRHGGIVVKTTRVTLRGAVQHPKIYAYTAGENATSPWIGPRSGEGLVKVGFTLRSVAERIREQLNPVKMPVPVEPNWVLSAAAIRDDGRAFDDFAVHRALVAAGVHRRDGEWFECSREEVAQAIVAVRSGKELGGGHQQRFPLRPEQARAIDETAAYFTAHSDEGRAPHFLWNAKMRFGKTFTSYQLARRLDWSRVLVLTYKPAVEMSWRQDLMGHEDFAGWRFKGKGDAAPDLSDPAPVVWFASFQDVLGKDVDGQVKAKNQQLYDVAWDVVVVDEYHFGAWRDAARSMYAGDADAGLAGDASEARVLDTPDLEEGFASDLEDTLPLEVRHYLYLSGTPFRALTEGEFLEDQVFNWTYSDEQRAKEQWPEADTNPYAALPQMRLLTYEMPDRLREVALNNRAEFSLTEFFRTRRDGDAAPTFVHEQEVQKWLDLLRGQDLGGLWENASNLNRPPMPFEDVNLLEALQHSVWFLPSVDACFAMKDLLEAKRNTFFRDYTVVAAAGPKAGMGQEALKPVFGAIGGVPQASKSITLSCGKLMTGVTVSPWTAILMLRELKSPETYFQAAFRVQNPWVSMLPDLERGGERQLIHKHHCYVIDFAPNRALGQVVDYATRLRAEIASERDQEEAVEEFMEFLPVLSFDGYSMNQLKAADVIDYLQRGVSATMLARRWNSPELLLFDAASWKRLLENAELLAALERIEVFRNITRDVQALIAANDELKQKRLAQEKPTKEEKQRQDEAKRTRESLRKRLQRLVTRLPAFMYLTDDRERTLKDVIEQLEPELFTKVTGITLENFRDLVDAGIFHEKKMNDAVWKFREFEEPSLGYAPPPVERTVGGWTLRRDESFAELVDTGSLSPGDVLVGGGDVGVTAVVSEDYGLLVEGIRYESPDAAASAQGEPDGWAYWMTTDGGTQRSLRYLRDAGASTRRG